MVVVLILHFSGSHDLVFTENRHADNIKRVICLCNQCVDRLFILLDMFIFAVIPFSNKICVGDAKTAYLKPLK